MSIKYECLSKYIVNDPKAVSGGEFKYSIGTDGCKWKRRYYTHEMKLIERKTEMARINDGWNLDDKCRKVFNKGQNKSGVFWRNIGAE